MYKNSLASETKSDYLSYSNLYIYRVYRLQIILTFAYSDSMLKYIVTGALFRII